MYRRLAVLAALYALAMVGVCLLPSPQVAGQRSGPWSRAAPDPTRVAAQTTAIVAWHRHRPASDVVNLTVP